MFSVTTRPESLTTAATTLHGIGTAMEAQNAAAAAPTTGVVPAAADEVSALQATQFAAYGSLYQQIGSQAAAINEMITNALASNANSYAAAEAVNATATGSSNSGIAGQLIALLTATVPPSSGWSGLLAIGTGNTGIIGAMQASNFGSAVSAFLPLAANKTLVAHAATGGAEGLGGGLVGSPGLSNAILTGAVEPAGPSALSTAPAAASASGAATTGATSLPPSWAGETAPIPNSVAETLGGTGIATAAAHNAPSAIMSAGLPAAAAAQRGGFGRGRPRYGVKPTVMPKPHRAV